MIKNWTVPGVLAMGLLLSILGGIAFSTLAGPSGIPSFEGCYAANTSFKNTTDASAEDLDHKVGWPMQSAERYPYLVRLQTGAHAGFCTGVVIHKQLVLTTASCIDLAGPYPNVVLGYPGWSGGWAPGIQELRAEWASMHPGWKGSAAGCCNAAIVKLPKRVNVTAPTLAGENFAVYRGLILEGINPADVPKLSRWKAVQSSICQGPGHSQEGSFCLVPESAQSNAGVMAMILDNYSMGNGTARGLPGLDLFVGLCIPTNSTFESESVIPGSAQDRAVDCASISGIRKWIEQHKSQV
ncbi:unnamed protein product [Ostreobium quekettii]|uniref:Peptidase S1 domain-containing protein n=1 Tax=Ostreobium quekettii TaxID=121088 RepID=A0A8S1ITE6_9CHLO|nr:unnamed protein product [Ostreobium quekettii]